MEDKDKVLVCISDEWRDSGKIADEVSFVFKMGWLEATMLTIMRLLPQLKAENLIEEHDFNNVKKLNLYRLTPLGKSRQAELLNADLSIIVRQEDFLLAGCPI